MSGTVPPSDNPGPATAGDHRRRQLQQPEVPPAHPARRHRNMWALRAERSGHTDQPRRLLVELLEPGSGTQPGWTADVHAADVPYLHPDRTDTLHVGSHPDLASLLSELARILSALRQWWPDLQVRFTLNTSAAAARRAARLNGVDLPR